jgi:T4 bacteriophage base plate protein
MLPKNKHPLFKLTIPSTKEIVNCRPFLVREEKILLRAKSTEELSEILQSIKQVVNNCVQSDTFDVDDITIFDLEYLFLKLRAQSISNEIQLTYIDNEDKKEYSFVVDLNQIEVVFDNSISKIIKINDSSGIVMRYPKAKVYDDEDLLSSGDDSFFKLIARCVDQIYEGETVYQCSNVNETEILEYLDSLDVKTFDKIKTFMIKQPHLEHTIKYKNSLDSDRTINLRSLEDFFTLR